MVVCDSRLSIAYDLIIRQLSSGNSLFYESFLCAKSLKCSRNVPMRWQLLLLELEHHVFICMFASLDVYLTSTKSNRSLQLVKPNNSESIKLVCSCRLKVACFHSLLDLILHWNSIYLSMNSTDIMVECVRFH